MKRLLPFYPAVEGNPEGAAFARDVYHYIWLAMGVLTLLWLFLVLIFPDKVNIWMTFYIPSMIALFVGQWLNYRGKPRYTVIVLLVSGWTVFTLMAVLYWKVLPPDNNRYMIIVVAAGLLLGKRAGIFAATVCGLTDIVLTLLVGNGTIPAPDPRVAIVTLLPHLFFLYMAALVPAFATRRVRAALRIAEEQREEHRVAEEMTAANHARFLGVVNGSPDAIVIHRDGKFLHLNPAALRLMRADSQEQLLGKSILQVVHPDYTQIVSTALEEMSATKATSQMREGKMLRMDGSAAFVETASMPVTFDHGPAIQTIIRDVSEIRSLQEQMHLQIAALNSAANGIVITDKRGSIVWANPAFEALTGYSAVEITGRNPRELVNSGKQSGNFYKDMWSTILAGKVWHGELVNRRKDGKLYDEMMTITPVTNSEGTVTHFVAVKEDVTSRKLLEQQLLQSQKLEGIGQLAGGVAHDYNNILNVVVGYAELLKRKFSVDEYARQSIESILSAARRGADLTRQLLAFARKEMLSPKVISVNSAVDSVKHMLQRIIGENLKLVFVPGKDLWAVKMDPTQLDQVLVNLVTNAKDAITDVGTITIRTADVTVSHDVTPAKSDLEPGDYVRIAIEDNGKGMDETTLKRIFEPFFTTKPKGHGTGLGLSTVYGIVKQNGGAVEVESKLDRGTIIAIYLPRFEGEAPASEETAADESLKGNETVLVVEDEADLLNLAKATLEEYGYNVIASLDPGDAELLSEAYAGEIHLLLTDVIMPKMSGKELSDRISARRPGIRTLFMSGYSSEIFTSAKGIESGIELIQKPFTLFELARKIRVLLSSHPAPSTLQSR